MRIWVYRVRNAVFFIEKANDRVVAARQKKKGMSWSNLGSNALAVISAVSINGELSNWIYKRDFPFRMAA